jgi:hypothetical protein
MELTSQQTSLLERLRSQGFEIVAFPMYAEYVGVRKGNCAALLAPTGAGGFSIYGQPAYLVGGNFSARVVQGNGHYFVSKKDKLEATPDRNSELEAFSAELAEALLPTA